jgi:D-glycero-alpha-D-manno-heptose-7-phosphate kinase
VRVSPVICPPGTLKRAHRLMALFYTGRQRSAATTLTPQKAAVESNDRNTIDALQKMRNLAYELRDRLSRGEIEALGPLLDQNWQLKRSLSGEITNPYIDEVYERAKDAGATGAKLLGAGSSGFFLVVAPVDRQARVRSVLDYLREVPFRFASRGTHIPLFEPEGG